MSSNLRHYIKANMQEELTMVYNTNKALMTEELAPRTAAYLFMYSKPLPPVGRCKLDPSLKATCFQTLNLRVHTVLST